MIGAGVGPGFFLSGFFGGRVFFDPTIIAGLVMAVGQRFTKTLDTSTNSPDTVSQLFDFSGNSNHANQLTKLNQPSIANGGVYYDGDVIQANGDRMVVTHSSSINLNTALTLFAVVKNGGTQGYTFPNIVRKCNNANTQGWVLGGQAATGQARLLVNNTATNFPGTPLGASRVLLTAVIDNGVTAVYLNNGSATTGSYTVGTGFGGTDNLSIGARADGDRPFEGNIDEVLLYNSALSIGDIDIVRNGLNASWGLW
jgi:hypothetical protein